MKPVVWLGNSLGQVRAFPEVVRQLAGYQLERVQAGLEPSDCKPMPSVGLGVNEIRVSAGGAFRMIYLAKFPEAVYVLHAFRKKSAATAARDLELARARFRALIVERKHS